MGQALSSVPQHDVITTQQHVPQHVSLPEDVAMSTQHHVSLPQHVSFPQQDTMSARQHVNLPQHDGMSTQKHVSFPKHATQLTKTTVPVVGTVSRRIDPEQTELEEDSIPRPATQVVLPFPLLSPTIHSSHRPFPLFP